VLDLELMVIQQLNSSRLELKMIHQLLIIMVQEVKDKWQIGQDNKLLDHLILNIFILTLKKFMTNIVKIEIYVLYHFYHIY